MDNIYQEAANNIRSMHEIESILNNDDIPTKSKVYFIHVVNNAIALPPKQQRNMNVLREMYMRIDKDTRMFRQFLNMIVELAQHFKFDNTSIIFAFKNISLESHFLNFVDFARRKNPIIERNNPLQLFLVLGLSILQLALNKNKSVSQPVDKDREYLMIQYRELNKHMTERFLNLDFGSEIVDQSQETYVNDLNSFNNDFGEEDNTISTDAQVHSEPVSTITVTAEMNKEQVPGITPIQSETEDCEEDLLDTFSYRNDDDNDDVNSDIIKTQENGNKEINLQNLENLVTEAGKTLAPQILNTMSQYSKEPYIHFNNNPLENFVDYIKRH